MTDLLKLADQIERTFAGHPDLAGEIAEFVRDQWRSREQCEGYTNYATFQVASLIDNDQALGETVRQLLADAISEPTEWPTLRQADALKDYVELLSDIAPTAGIRTQFAAGLKNAGLAEVNWKEIVEGLNE